RRMSDFRFYFGLGWEHIMSWDALDHIGFVLALAAVYLLRHWRQVAILVTAFTIGHSLTLALSTLRIISIPTKWVEFLIPCTIVFTALSNLVGQKDPSRTRRLNYFLALFFGLIHGLGFANTLQFLLAPDQSFGWGLFGFNVGLEAGQLVIVSAILLLSWLVVQRLRVPHRAWLMGISLLVLVFALKMALERLP
ncbi:MAG: HupE / UreJ protein, partial [Flaviaesturariibacter sp.]|nr:HupE / UreJ protein [Flaviaesturariibacter sp.]